MNWRWQTREQDAEDARRWRCPVHGVIDHRSIFGWRFHDEQYCRLCFEQLLVKVEKAAPVDMDLPHTREGKT